ncbi:MAG: DedA family protein [Balneolaceae bacterium]
MADQVIQSLIEWINAVPPGGIYLIFFGIAYLENIIPPLPGDVIVAFGGYLAAEGIIQVVPVWTLTTIASVFGFMTMYWLGYKWGEQIESNRDSHFLLRFIDYKYFTRGKKWMMRWGQGVVVANRFLAGTRSVISLTAGISRLKVLRTSISSFISSILWNGLLIGMGWIIQDNWRIIGDYLSNYGKIILILIAGVVLVKIWADKRKQKKNENTQLKE